MQKTQLHYQKGGGETKDQGARASEEGQSQRRNKVSHQGGQARSKGLELLEFENNKVSSRLCVLLCCVVLLQVLVLPVPLVAFVFG